jgi:hypothetical protein
MKECDISLPRDAPRPPPNREMSYVIKLNLLPLAFCRCVSCVPLSLFFAISVILYYLVSYLWCDGDTNADFLLNLESEFLDTTNKRHRSSFLDMHMTRERRSVFPTARNLLGIYPPPILTVRTVLISSSRTRRKAVNY